MSKTQPLQKPLEKNPSPTYVITVKWQQEKYQGKCPLVYFITTKLFSFWI